MLHGNIYPKERASRTLASFFRTDNLIALRELALRFLADETDEHLRRHEAGALDVDVHVIALRKASRAAPSVPSSAERPDLVQVSAPEEPGPDSAES